MSATSEAPGWVSPDDRLWAVTSYFNPVGYRHRLENYHQFRRRLAVPLVTVELSCNGRFDLQAGDADILAQFHGRDVMWQKERLLNLALARVPSSVSKIAWLDCDVVFESDDWVDRAARVLDEFPLAHLFREQHNLPRGAKLDSLSLSHSAPAARSVVCKQTDGTIADADLGDADAQFKTHSTTGHAWASRRDVLTQHGFYDAYILGGGDRGLLCAALGKFEQAAHAACMSEQRKQHYLAWARPFHDTIRGRVGYVPGKLFHLWHGDLADRRYGERHRRLASFAFDPTRDIALDGNQCWRWNSDKSAMHAFVRDYFASRKEDGE